MNASCPLWDDGASWIAGRQRRIDDCRRHLCRRHCARHGAGELLVVARVVGEGDPHPDGLARVGVGQGVGGSVCPVDLVVVEPLVGEGRVVEAVVVGYVGSVGGQAPPTWAVPVMVGNPVAGVRGPGTVN